MARGKQTCKILKEIRRQIAEANGIEFATSECRYKGDCLGTCPKCESEVRYLEQQLRTRSLAGKAIALAGISAGMILMSGCSCTSTKNQTNDDLLGEMPLLENSISCLTSEINGVKEGEISNETEVVVTHGDIAMKPEYDTDENKIYNIVEQMPEYPGGQAALLKFIGANLKYPKEMVGCFKGSVRVRFYVDTLGRVCDPQIVRGMDSALDSEVLRVVRLFPDFIPGLHEGKKVNVYLNLPISFDPNRYLLMKGNIPAMTDTITVKGIVLSGDTLPDGGISKEPLIGATISNNRTALGAITNLDGHFGLPASVGDTLKVEYVGYEPQTIVVTEDVRNVEITLAPNNALLGEVVLAGVMPYDTKLRKNHYLDLNVIDEKGNVIVPKDLYVERIWIDNDGDEDSEYISPEYFDDKHPCRIYWDYDYGLQDEDGKPLKEAILRIEAEGYDDPITIKVKYPKRNAKKTIKFRHKKK